MLLPPGAIGSAGVMVSDVGDMRRWVEAYVAGTTNSAATQAARLQCVDTGIAGVRFGLRIGCTGGWYGYTAVGVCVAADSCDSSYSNGSGASVVAYAITDPKVATAASVRATLYYQSIPPYFLQQRATDATGTDTDRLKFFRQNLEVAGTAIENWKLRIVSATQTLP